MIPGLEPVVLIQRRGEIDGATGLPDVSTTRVPTYASIQPAEGDTMERVPEGFRIDDVRILYLYRQILVKAANPKTQTLADHFEFSDGGSLDQWAVQVVPDWRQVLPHYEIVVTRVKEQEIEA